MYTYHFYQGLTSYKLGKLRKQNKEKKDDNKELDVDKCNRK